MGWISPHFAKSYIRPPIRSSRPIIKPIPGHLTRRRSWSSGRNIALRCPDDATRQHDDDDIACPLFKLLNVNGTIGNHNPNVAKNNLDWRQSPNKATGVGCEKQSVLGFLWNSAA